MVLKEQVSLGPGGWVGTTGGTRLGDEQGGQRRTLQCAWTKQGGLPKQGSLTCQGVVEQGWVQRHGQQHTGLGTGCVCARCVYCW